MRDVAPFTKLLRYRNMLTLIAGKFLVFFLMAVNTCPPYNGHLWRYATVRRKEQETRSKKQEARLFASCILFLASCFLPLVSYFLPLALRPLIKDSFILIFETALNFII